MSIITTTNGPRKWIVNDAGLDIIKTFEGFSSTPYLCPAGVPTIGFGSTRLTDGSRVALDHPASDETAGEVLLRLGTSNVERAIGRLVRVRLSANQFSALVSWAYNVGSGNMQASTLRRKINRGDYAGAAEEFPKWRKTGGRILAGLVQRRERERGLFLG